MFPMRQRQTNQQKTCRVIAVGITSIDVATVKANIAQRGREGDVKGKKAGKGRARGGQGDEGEGGKGLGKARAGQGEESREDEGGNSMKEALGNFGGWLDEMIVWFQQPWNKPIPSMESASGPSAAPDGEKSFEGDAVRLLDLWEAMEAHPFAQHSSGTIDLRQLGMFIGRFSAQSAGVKERHRNLLDTVTRLKVRAMLMCRNMVGYSGTLNVDTCMICFIQISEACNPPCCSFLGRTLSSWRGMNKSPRRRNWKILCPWRERASA